MTTSKEKKNGSTAIRVLIVLGAIISLKVIYRVSQNKAFNTPQQLSFAEARAAHKTKLLVSKDHDSGSLPELYTDFLEHTQYERPLGKMGAIATPVGETGAMKPAVVWVTGGFGGIPQGADLYDSSENDQGIASFLGQNIVIFLPAFRGEHQNPGVFECFYGEVNDLVAAVEHVANRVDVDPERIYLMGHSTGGTNVLLASLLTDIPVGVVSFGGAPDMEAVVADGSGYGVEPYDMTDSEEVWLRSAIRFTQDIRVPVLYIEGSENPFYSGHARRMERIADEAGVDFTAAIIEGADHYNVLRPIKDLLADRIESGQTELPSPKEVQNAFTSYVEDPSNHLIEKVDSGTAIEIRKILENGADPDKKSPYGWPVLMLAASNNNSEVVSALLQAGADPNAENSEGGTPIVVACIRNQDNVKVLIDAGADVNCTDASGMSPLMYAVIYSNDANVSERLIVGGSDVRLRDGLGRSALMYAAMNTSNPVIINQIVEAGGDINATDNRGFSVLINAAVHSNFPVVIKAIVGLGADVNERSRDGATPLMVASMESENPQVVQAFLDAGALAHYQDYSGYNAVDYASQNQALKDSPVYALLVEASTVPIP